MSEDRSDMWKLPEPVFRSSTGELVKPSERMDIDPEPDTLEPGYAERPPDEGFHVGAEGLGEQASEAQLAGLYDPVRPAAEPETPVASHPANAVEIEPQPQISEQFTQDQLEPEPDEAKPRTGSVVRTVLLTLLFIILLGILGLAVIAAYIYFAGRSSSGQF